MERRELDKQTPGQTDQPGKTGSSGQRQRDGRVPPGAQPPHPRAPVTAEPRPGQHGTGCAARDHSPGYGAGAA